MATFPGSMFCVPSSSSDNILLVSQKRLHDSPKIAQYLPEAAMVIIIGMIAGAFFHLVAYKSTEMAGDIAESVLAFDSSIFFIVLLPPIIFNSGYHLHRQLLLRYFTPICLFAFAGTMISMGLVAGMLYGICSVLSFSPSFHELLAFGALM
jgi:NhaP-type Na+/H+ or K+/H+ antiporter